MWAVAVGVVVGKGVRRMVTAARFGTLCALAITAGSPTPAAAVPFRLGPVQGLANFSLSYGLLARVEGRDPDFIGIGNGGRAPSVNIDDGDLNQDVGLVSNQFRGTAELTLLWRRFGLVLRGYGFYDFQNSLDPPARTDLSNHAKRLVGRGGALQDAFLTARFAPGGMPIVIRVGRQVVTWGEASLLRFGVDIVNPLDLVSLAQPTTDARDALVRQGMVWAAANVTESLSVEALYQYEWKPMRRLPVGTFFSADDLIGGDGVNTAFSGAGEFSDQGTDLDAFFGVPLGGFDRNFMRIPASGRIKPSDQGQGGFSIRAIVSEWNATKLAIHFMNYHSRFPLISAHTADQSAIDRTSRAAVDARAAALSIETGLPLEETIPIAETVTIGKFTQDARYFASYPEDIRMLGFSFNAVPIWTGTLVSGEYSHHFRWPVQIPRPFVLGAALSPIEFTDAFATTPLGRFDADETVSGVVRVGKSQASLGFSQLLGPQLFSSQSLISIAFGWIHMHDLPAYHPFDADSWGYRIIGQLTYDNILGAISVRPSLVFAHDVNGVTPGPGGAFLEGRMLLSAALGFDFQRTWTSVVSYSRDWGASRLNLGRDRDFVRFNLTFHY
jgi:hypothetical protein